MKPLLTPSATANDQLRLFTSKTMNNLLKTWQGVRGSARMLMRGKTIRPHLPDEDLELLTQQIQACLEPKGGEVTARANTIELGKQYLELNEKGRVRFFKLLAEKFDVNHTDIKRKAAAIAKAQTLQEQQQAEAELRHSLISARITLLRQFNGLPDGFKFLVDMRAEMLEALPQNPEITAVEEDLKQILSAWFDIGLLDLVEITWQSPAELLEKLMVYEAVHAIRSWDDLKNRLDTDRRVFAFFHNKMPMEPLIFVQVAFWEGLGNSIQQVLDIERSTQDVQGMDTALFYSISNAQKGLAGISFGNFLIKRVVGRLGKELPHIRHFATLSPIPAFGKWLGDQLKADKDEALFLPSEIKELRRLGGEPNACTSLAKLLAGKWQDEARITDAVKPVLMRLCTRYLTQEKRKGKALDPVAHFHLSNGARMEQLNWLADTSPKGIKQSAGMMVNYYYHLPDIDDNHEDYVTDGKISQSKSVQQWLKN